MEVRVPSLKRKNFLVDEQALKKAKRILGAKTESDAVRQAISLVPPPGMVETPRLQAKRGFF